MSYGGKRVSTKHTPGKVLVKGQYYGPYELGELSAEDQDYAQALLESEQHSTTTSLQRFVEGSYELSDTDLANRPAVLEFLKPIEAETLQKLDVVKSDLEVMIAMDQTVVTRAQELEEQIKALQKELSTVQREKRKVDQLMEEAVVTRHTLEEQSKKIKTTINSIVQAPSQEPLGWDYPPYEGPRGPREPNKILQTVLRHALEHTSPFVLSQVSDSWRDEIALMRSMPEPWPTNPTVISVYKSKFEKVDGNYYEIVGAVSSNGDNALNFVVLEKKEQTMVCISSWDRSKTTFYPEVKYLGILEDKYVVTFHHVNKVIQVITDMQLAMLRMPKVVDNMQNAIVVSRGPHAGIYLVENEKRLKRIRVSQDQGYALDVVETVGKFNPLFEHVVVSDRFMFDLKTHRVLDLDTNIVKVLTINTEATKQHDVTLNKELIELLNVDTKLPKALIVNNRLFWYTNSWTKSTFPFMMVWDLETGTHLHTIEHTGTELYGNNRTGYVLDGDYVFKLNPDGSTSEYALVGLDEAVQIVNEQPHSLVTLEDYSDTISMYVDGNGYIYIASDDVILDDDDLYRQQYRQTPITVSIF